MTKTTPIAFENLAQRPWGEVPGATPLETALREHPPARQWVEKEIKRTDWDDDVLPQLPFSRSVTEEPYFLLTDAADIVLGPAGPEGLLWRRRLPWNVVGGANDRLRMQ